MPNFETDPSCKGSNRECGTDRNAKRISYGGKIFENIATDRTFDVRKRPENRPFYRFTGHPRSGKRVKKRSTDSNTRIRHCGVTRKRNTTYGKKIDAQLMRF